MGIFVLALEQNYHLIGTNIKATEIYFHQQVKTSTKIFMLTYNFNSVTFKL